MPMDIDEVDVKPNIKEVNDWMTSQTYHGKSLTDEIKTVEVSLRLIATIKLNFNL